MEEINIRVIKQPEQKKMFIEVKGVDKSAEDFIMEALQKIVPMQPVAEQKMESLEPEKTNLTNPPEPEKYYYFKVSYEQKDKFKNTFKGLTKFRAKDKAWGVKGKDNALKAQELGWIMLKEDCQ